MEWRKVSFGKRELCYEITLNNLKMIVTADVGPRILFFGFKDGENVLFHDKEEKLSIGEMKLYGGHRFWISPESKDTYNPDNTPCKVEEEKDKISFISFDPITQIEKKLSILEKNGNFIVRHILTNKGKTLYPGAIWALTCIPPKKGIIFFPWGTRGNWQLKKIIYWQRWGESSGTNVKSSQFVPEEDLFLIYPSGEEGKVGTAGYEGFVGVTTDNYTFIKKFNYIEGALYPDDNCAIEVYTSPNFCELETLSPMYTLIPNAEVKHDEEWILLPYKVDPKNGKKVREILR
jgi:hypothetical protein